MARPSKPVSVIKMEGKSHRTKAELEQRRIAEEKLLSKVRIKEKKEVRENPEAHKEFLRLRKLLENIEKNDALYENVINRYALIIAECIEFEEKREHCYVSILELEESKAELISNESMTLSEYFKIKSAQEKMLLDYDKQIQAKRKMLFEIEKENILTIASSIRNVPKSVTQEEDNLISILRG